MAGQGCQSPRQLQPTAMPQTVGCVCCADQLRKQYSVCGVCSTVWVVCVQYSVGCVCSTVWVVCAVQIS